MQALGKKLEKDDQSELVFWIRQKDFGCTVRPLRRHPQYGGSRALLPAETRDLIERWVELLKVEGINSILSLMHEKYLGCYSAFGFESGDLISHLCDAGFEVARCPYEDPHHKSSSKEQKLKTLRSVRTQALASFLALPKPVLIMCSSGIDRSAPVAAFIVESESDRRQADANYRLV